MSLGLAFPSIVLLGTLVIVGGLITYALIQYSMILSEAQEYGASVNQRMIEAASSCIAYLDNGTLRFPYTVNVIRTIPPNALGPGRYSEIRISNLSALVFTEGCAILINGTSYRVLGGSRWG
jgi:hypothetical protein